MKKIWLSASTAHGLGIVAASDVDQSNTVKASDFTSMLGTTFDGEVFALFDVESATELTAEYYTWNNDIVADLTRLAF